MLRAGAARGTGSLKFVQPLLNIAMRAARRAGEVIVRIPGATGPAIGEKIRAVAARDKLHLFSSDGRKRVEI